jgi:hypothetical protein
VFAIAGVQDSEAHIAKLEAAIADISNRLHNRHRDLHPSALPDLSMSTLGLTLSALPLPVVAVHGGPGSPLPWEMGGLESSEADESELAASFTITLL